MERQISVSCLVAYSLWGVTLLVWALAWVVDVPALLALSIIIAMVAATATIRTYFVAQSSRIKSSMALVVGSKRVSSLHR